MPSRACTAGSRCSNHRNLEPALKPECREFVVIGNGPSGIALSYLLSGNWPYYKGYSQDEFLHTRLSLQPDLSLVEQDLQFLSDGLEGRSNNPVSLLMDALQKPEADLGLELPSLLEWRQVEEGKVDHVVLGRGKPGGIWQTLDQSLLTVSLGGWMELPSLPMDDWRRITATKEPSPELKTRRTSAGTLARYYPDYVQLMGLDENFVENTVVTSVRQLHGEVEDEKMISEQEEPSACDEIFCFETEEAASDDLSSQCSSMTGQHRRSLSSISVDSSLPPPSLPSPSDRLRPPPEPYSCSLQCDYDDCDLLCSWNPIMNPSLFGSYKSSVPCSASLDAYSASLQELGSKGHSWRRPPLAPPPPPHPVFEVAGYRVTDEGQKPFKYLARNVVLATGQADTPNRLEVAGEDLPFVLHSVPELETVVASGKITSGSDPVLVVGAGLSAADAIISAQGHRLPVAHLFRKRANDPQLIFAKLPSNLYPEYHAVHAMMAGRSEANNNIKSPNVGFEEGAKMYTAWAESEVVEILEDQRVVIRGPEGTHTTLKVSYVVVLIGACPNLSFLSSQGDQLGRVPGHAIDRNNTIDISAFTHQSNNVPGLFALGPLTGDNFVRFIQGGALAIASHVHQTRRSSYSD